MVQPFLSRGYFPPSLIRYLFTSSTHKKQLQHNAPTFLIGASANKSSAPVGINPKCGIQRVGFGSSVGNIANILACSFSILVLIWLIIRCNSRKAAVGKSSCPPALSIFLPNPQVVSSFVHFSSFIFSPSPSNLSRRVLFSSKDPRSLSSLQPSMQVLSPLFSGHSWETLSWLLKLLRMVHRPH